MRLIYILVIAVSVLTILSGFALIFGSNRTERPRNFWFLAAALGEALWGCSIVAFLSLGATAGDYVVAPWLVKGIYAGGIIMDVSLLGYNAWKYRSGKFTAIVFASVGLGLLAAFFVNPSLLYSDISLGGAGNSIAIDLSRWFYPVYSVYFCAITPALCVFLIRQIRQAKSKNQRSGHLIFMGGMAVAGLVALIFDIVLPPMRYDLIWVGPLAIGIFILGFYYAILRFRIIALSTAWLRIMSYLVIVSSAIIVYLLIFHLVFSALFKVSNPSFQVILLNFIMIAIVLLLTPAIMELSSMTRSLILVKQIDLAYIVKKLTKINVKKTNLREISGFLADRMHYEYAGFLIDGKFYVEGGREVSVGSLATVAALPKPDHGIWQDLANVDKDVKKDLGIFRVAIMTNSSGEVIGQMILGRPVAKPALDRKDIVETEMVVNLMGTLLENGRR